MCEGRGNEKTKQNAWKYSSSGKLELNFYSHIGFKAETELTVA